MTQKSSFFRRSADNTDENQTTEQQDVELTEYVPRKRATTNREETSDTENEDQPRKPRTAGTSDSAEEDQPRKPRTAEGSDRGERPSLNYRSDSGDRDSRFSKSDRNDRDRSDRNDRSRSFDRSDRNDRGRSFDRSDRKNDFAKRPPRGERPDFRKPENRKPIEDREAPENIIYGIHPVIEAIEMGKPIEKVYFRRQSSADSARYEDRHTHNNEAIEQIRSMLVGSDIVSQDVPPEKLDRLSRRGNHQGVVAVVSAVEYLDFNTLLDKLTSAEAAPLVVVMDSVTDVRNFGAIARSAECAGADAIIMSAKNSAPVNAEAMRSSAGALSIIPVCRVGSLRNSLKSLQMAGLQLVAATEKSNNILFEADMTKPTVIIMGSEDKGISNEVLKMCDARISIPLLGKIESMNVSAAAAVMLFEAVRQRFMAIDQE